MRLNHHQTNLDNQKKHTQRDSEIKRSLQMLFVKSRQMLAYLFLQHGRNTSFGKLRQSSPDTTKDNSSKENQYIQRAIAADTATSSLDIG